MPILSKIIVDKTDASDISSVGSGALVAPQPKVILSPFGLRVLESWRKIETLNKNVFVQKFVFMPDHIHGIIFIKNEGIIEHSEKIYNFDFAERRGRRSLQGIIKDFKSVTTRMYKKDFSADHSLWQESFYEEIIRSQDHYNRIWTYIDQNPLRRVLKDNIERN